VADLPGPALTWKVSPLFNRLNSITEAERRHLSLLRGKLHNICYKKRSALLWWSSGHKQRME